MIILEVWYIKLFPHHLYQQELQPGFLQTDLQYYLQNLSLYPKVLTIFQLKILEVLEE